MSPTKNATPPAPTTINPRRGEIYWVKIPSHHTVGSEQQKRRPWLVVSNNSIHYLNVLIAVPLSMKAEQANQTRILIPQADLLFDQGNTLVPGDRVALTHQIRVLAVERLEPQRQARLADTRLYAVEAGLAFVLDIP